MRWLAILGVGVMACSFQPASSGPGGAAADGGTDVSRDAVTAAATCRSPSTTTIGGLVGGTNGGMRAPERCGPDEIAIAFALEMTDGPRWAGRIASARARLTCAKIARAAGEGYRAIPSAPIVINPMVCNPFDGPVATATTTCPAGSVLVGFRASAIPLSGDSPTCFSNVTVLCAPIEGSGRPGAIGPRLRIEDTFNNGLTETDVACPAGEAVRGVIPNDGCGLDGMRLLCGPVTCD